MPLELQAAAWHWLTPWGQGVQRSPQLLTLALLRQTPSQSWKPAAQVYRQLPPAAQATLALACGGQQLPLRGAAPGQTSPPSGHRQLPLLQVAPATQSLLAQHSLPVTQRLGPVA